MDVAIIGARLRSEPEDSQLVNSLIDGLQRLYGRQLFVITTNTDRGIGKIVRNRCLDAHARPLINLLDIAYKPYVDDLPKAKFAEKFLTKNYSIVAAAEEFHLFMDGDTRGYMVHLLNLINDEGLPVSVYNLGEKTGPKLLR